MRGGSSLVPSVGLLALAVLLAYANVPGNGFHYDDEHSILENPHLRSLANAPRFFSDSATFSGLAEARMYRPLVVLSYAVNYALGGYEPLGYHLVNMGLHLVNALLVWQIALALGMRAGPALGAGLLFSVHPVLSEPVNYISSRSSQLATCFVALAFLLYVRGRAAALVGASYAAALLAKSSAIALPALLLLVSKRRGHAALYISAALSGLYLWGTQAIVGKAMLQPVRSHWAQWATQSKALVFYVYKAFSPYALSVEPQFRVSPSFAEGTVLVGLAALVSLAFIALRGGRGVALLGAGWFFIALLPPSIVPLNVLVNEHRLYFPMVGGALFLADILGRLRLSRVVALCALVAMASLCHQRNGAWRSAEILWADAVEKGPQMPRPYVNWAQALLQSGRVDESIAASRQALELQPDLARAHYNLGTAYMHQERYELAEAHLLRAVGLDSGLFAAQNNLGNLYQELGQSDQALDRYKRAAAIGEYASLFYNMGQAHLQAGRPDSAARYFRSALERDSHLRAGYRGLAEALRTGERFNDAIAVLEEGLLTWPQDGEFARLLAASYAGLGRDEAARAVYRRLGMSPAQAWALLAGEALRRGRWQRAYDCVQEALQTEQSAALYNDLGAALVGMERVEEGLQAFRRAARLDPQAARSYANIGRVYLQHARYADAVAALQRAVELDTQNGAFCALLGRAYEGAGKGEQALQWYRRAVDNAPASAAHRSLLAQRYQAMGQFGQAERLYREALERDADDVETLCNLSALYLQGGRSKQAVALLVRAVRLAPGRIDAHVGLARAYADQGDRTRAQNALRAALELDVDAAERARLEAQMRALGEG